MKNRARTEIVRIVSARFADLPQEKEAQRSSRPPEQDFFREIAEAERDRGVAVEAAVIT